MHSLPERREGHGKLEPHGDAPDRRHPDGRTREQAKVFDREVIRRRDARAERSRGEPYQEAPKKADGRYPKLFKGSFSTVALVILPNIAVAPALATRAGA